MSVQVLLSSTRPEGRRYAGTQEKYAYQSNNKGVYTLQLYLLSSSEKVWTTSTVRLQLLCGHSDREYLSITFSLWSYNNLLQCWVKTYTIIWMLEPVVLWTCLNASCCLASSCIATVPVDQQSSVSSCYQQLLLLLSWPGFSGWMPISGQDAHLLLQ